MTRFARLSGALLILLGGIAPAAAQFDPDPPVMTQLRNKSAQARLNQGLPAVDPATQRAPRVTDDTTRGYAVGDKWLDETTGRMWIALGVAANKAAWVPIKPSLALPLDGFTAPKAVYATCRQIGTYSGPAMTLTRTSDSATIVLQFRSDNCVDEAEGDKFCYADPITCYVTTWNDQSGNAYDATAVVANAPRWDPKHRLNGRRVVSFESIKHTIAGGGPSATDQYLNIPAGMSWTPTQSSWVMVGMQNNSKSRADEAGILAAADYSTGWNQSKDGGGMSGLGTGGQITMAIPSSPSVTMVAGGTNFWRAWVRGKYEQTSHPTDVGVKTGGVIGYNPTYGGASMHVAALVIWDSILSANSTQPAVLSPMEQYWRVARQADNIVAVWGASDAAGTSSVTGGSWPFYMVPLVTPGTVVYNLGSHGMTLVVAQTYKETFIGELYSSAGGASARNFVVVLTMVLNDVRQGQTLAQIKTNLQALVAYAKGLGSNVKVVVTTRPLSCDFVGDSASIAIVQGYNQWIATYYNTAQAASGVGADAYIDQFANPLVSDSSYVNSGLCTGAISYDGIHLRDGTDHEYQQASSIEAAPVINRQLP